MEQRIHQLIMSYMQDYEEAFVVVPSEDGSNSSEVLFDLSKKDKMLAWFDKYAFMSNLTSAMSIYIQPEFTGDERHDNFMACHLYEFGTIPFGQFQHLPRLLLAALNV